MDPYSFFKFFAFLLPPELAHNIFIDLAKHFPHLAEIFNFDMKKYSKLETCFFDKRIKSPLGLAAGLDKNAECLEFFEKLNFGFLEIGTITPKPQPGNPKPRLFRYKNEKSLRNCFGFNSYGSDYIKAQIKNFKGDIPIGLNFGKNKLTVNELAIDDYAFLFGEFKNLGHYHVVNVSSPNTKDLRKLQTTNFISDLMSSIDKSKPIFIKLSPDEEREKIINLIEQAIKWKLGGIILTNTSNMPLYGVGGVSGKLIKEKSKRARNLALEVAKAEKNFEIIGVGGIDSFLDVLDFWEHGGRLFQIYTSLIYQGPGLLKTLYNEMLSFLDEMKTSNLDKYFESLQIKNSKSLN